MTTIHRSFARRRWAFLLPPILGACSTLSRQACDVHQAIWVTRFDYRTEADVREIVRNCARAGFDTLFFQVRGNGTVFYRSRIEPWAEQFGWRDPGFDPLRVACDEAYRQGIRLHAWVNAVPGWRGARPPDHPGQLYRSHPEWFLVDQHGERQPLVADYYVALNPCLPEVRAHIAGVCAEIAERYPVDGIHLDYIRFLEKDGDRDYPYDARTLERYRAATGLVPAADPQRWDRWRTDQVSELVREIRRAIRAVKRRVRLSAAVFAPPERALRVHQDWVHWLRRGWIDFAVPMVYDSDDRRFRRRLDAIGAAVSGLPVVVGIGVFKHRDPEQTLRQIDLVRRLGFPGFSLFSYSSFYRTRAAERSDPEEAALRELRRSVILPKLRGGAVVGAYP